MKKTLIITVTLLFLILLFLPAIVYPQVKLSGLPRTYAPSDSALFLLSQDSLGITVSKAVTLGDLGSAILLNIPEYTAATSISSADNFYLNQSGNKRVPWSVLNSTIETSIGGYSNIVLKTLGSTNTMRGTYTFDGNSSVNFYDDVNFIPGSKLVLPTHSGLTDWRSLTVSGSTGSSWLTFNRGTSQIDSLLPKRWLRESFDASVDLKPASIGLSSLTTALINYINSAGGGSITNNPDDITLENTGGSTIGIKQSWVDANLTRLNTWQNIPGRKNFLAEVKFGADSSVTVKETSMNEYFEFQRKQNTGLTGWAFKVKPYDTFLPAFELRSLEPANDDYGDPYDHPFASYYIGTNINGDAADATSLYWAWEVGYKSPYATSPGSIIDELWVGWRDSISGAQHRPIFMTFERKTNQQMISFNVDHLTIQNRDGVQNPAFDFWDTGNDGDLAVLHPSLTLQSGSSYMLVGDHAKLYSISERDTNWLLQAGYSLIKFGSFSDGSALWVNPNTNLVTTRIGQNLIVSSNTSAKNTVTLLPTGSVNYFNGSYLNFQSRYINFVDTLGNVSFIYDAQAKNLTLGAAEGSASGLMFAAGYYVVGNKVVGARDLGWTAFTGTTDESTAWATSTVTLEQLAQRVAALQVALTTHGLIGP